MAHPNLFAMDENTLSICSRLDEFCDRFFHAYQGQALQELDSHFATEVHHGTYTHKIIPTSLDSFKRLFET